MIKRTLKKTDVKQKDDFLNPHQRKQLKEILVGKFTKIKGKGAEDLIRQMIEEFFKNTQKINGKTIIELENKIKNEVKVCKGKAVQVKEELKVVQSNE